MAKGKKTGGRKKGTPNTVTKEVRELIKGVLEGELENIEETLAQAEPKDRLQFIAKLLPYTIAQYANIEEKPEDTSNAESNSFLSYLKQQGLMAS